MKTRLAVALRAYPTMLRVGLAESIAYRAEIAVWFLTNTMPLVNLALWSAVTRSGPIADYDQQDLVAYFMSALVVRQLTGSWVLWELMREIRMGLLSMRLMRPVHPLVSFSADNLSALPLRACFSIPVAAIGIWFAAGTDKISHDWFSWALLPVALIGSWLLTFLVMATLGSLAFFIDQALGIFDVWLALYFSLSGYLFPLDFLAQRAAWAPALARSLPFYSMNGFPVELMLGQMDHEGALRALAVQWSYAAALLIITSLVWRAGMRRYNAFGA